jgi:hypothetical protein
MDKKIDIVFSFDTTGSMYPCLAEVRRRVREVTKRLFADIPNIRIGIIAHGDYYDKGRPYMVCGLDLSKNIEQIREFVASVKPTMGGDWPECYEVVLNHAQTLDWREDADSKVLVMIGDATPHLPGYVWGDQRCKHNWRTECGKLHKQGISIYAVQAMAGYGRTQEKRFYNEMAKLTGGVKLELNQLSNIIQLVMAVCFKESSDEQFKAYETELRSSGQLNRSIAAILDAVAGRKRSTFTAASSSVLRPVDPSRFQMVSVEADCAIKAFVVDEMGANFKVGRGFYEFTKRETIQESKEVILVDKTTGDMWTGDEARDMIGVPTGTRGRVSPTELPYSVFVQSTSWNRKLKRGTRFLYESPEYGMGS